MEADEQIGKDQPLKVEVHDGRLVISVGVDTLKYCHNLTENERDVDFGSGFRIADAEGFARDIVGALKEEQEDGTTPVHLMLDKAIQDAADQGSIHTEDRKELEDLDLEDLEV